MKKKPVGRTQIAKKPLTIIVTVMPPKKGVRRLVVSAAPEGEMPTIVAGTFPERHALLDRAYAAVLKRNPQVVTVADKVGHAMKEPKKGKVSADQIRNAGSKAEEEPGNREPDEDGEKGDQSPDKAGRAMVEGDSPSPPALPEQHRHLRPLPDGERGEELPAIEGDDVPAVAELSDISLPDISDADEVQNG